MIISYINKTKYRNTKLSDSYAGWSFHTPVRATQARQVEG